MPLEGCIGRLPRVSPPFRRRLSKAHQKAGENKKVLAFVDEGGQEHEAQSLPAGAQQEGGRELRVHAASAAEHLGRAGAPGVGPAARLFHANGTSQTGCQALVRAKSHLLAHAAGADGGCGGGTESER